MLTDVEPESDYNFPYEDPYLQFWKEHMTSILNTTRNLTSLSLYSDVIAFNEWGLVSSLPSLENLTLSKFLFAYEDFGGDRKAETFCLESFILRHRKTLRHLDLIDCCIDISSEFYSWAQIFRNFEQHLDEIRFFRFHPPPFVGTATEDDGDPDGYVWRLWNERGGRYVDFFDDYEFPDPDTGELDRLAFDYLQRTIKQRNQG